MITEIKILFALLLAFVPVIMVTILVKRMERRAFKRIQESDRQWCGMTCDGGSERRKCGCRGPRDCYLFPKGRV